MPPRPSPEWEVLLEPFRPLFTQMGYRYFCAFVLVLAHRDRRLWVTQGILAGLLDRYFTRFYRFLREEVWSLTAGCADTVGRRAMGEGSAGLSVFDGHEAFCGSDCASILRVLLDWDRFPRCQARVRSDDVSGQKQAEHRVAGASALVGADVAAASVLAGQSTTDLRRLAQAPGLLDVVPAEAALPGARLCFGGFACRCRSR